MRMRLTIKGLLIAFAMFSCFLAGWIGKPLPDGDGSRHVQGNGLIGGWELWYGSEFAPPLFILWVWGQADGGNALSIRYQGSWSNRPVPF